MKSTKRNGKSLLVGGYKFRYHQTLADKKHWRCVVVGCKSRCHTDLKMKELLKVPGDHVHAPDDAKNYVLAIVAGMKRKLEQEPDQPVKRVYDRALQELNTAENAEELVTHFPRFHQIKTVQTALEKSACPEKRCHDSGRLRFAAR